MIKRILLACLSLMLLLGSMACKKNEASSPQLDDEETLLRDSTYFYSILLSLWSDELPQPEMMGEKIDLQAYTGQFQDAEGVLADLRRFAPEDRFSFVDRAGRVGEEIEAGVHKETGATPIYLGTRDSGNNGDLYIKLVQRGSPAEKAGLKRGMRVWSINGDEQMDYLTDQAQSFGNFNKFFSGETLELVVQEPGSEERKAMTVTGAAYQLNPILEARVIQLGTEKVGYLALTRFLSVFTRDGLPNSYHTALVEVFQKFEQDHIDELVIDLRYNGGGATNAAELMANLIVPAARGQDRMYSYQTNRYLEEEGFTDAANPNAPFQPVDFAKTNELDLSRVYFLATESSASASELVINVLEPHMDTQLITVNHTGTHGKPVGYFGYPVVNGYADLYITSFQMLNSAGFGDYFDGLRGEKMDAVDGFLQQLGDEEESMLAEALYHVQHGQYRSARATRSSTKVNSASTMRRMHTPELHPHRSNMFRFSDQKLPLHRK